MEVANLSVAIAPPVFSHGVEEARKDNAVRETIPQLPQSESSAKQGPAGGDATSGTNSSLYAQSQALVQNATEHNQNKGRDKEQSKDKKNASKLEATGSTLGSSSKSAISSATTTTVATASSTVAVAVSASSVASAKSSANSKVQESQRVHAKYSAAVSEQLSADDQKHLNAIANRYNATANIKQLGTNVDDRI